LLAIFMLIYHDTMAINTKATRSRRPRKRVRRPHEANDEIAENQRSYVTSTGKVNSETKVGLGPSRLNHREARGSTRQGLIMRHRSDSWAFCIHQARKRCAMVIAKSGRTARKGPKQKIAETDYGPLLANRIVDSRSNSRYNSRLLLRL